MATPAHILVLKLPTVGSSCSLVYLPTVDMPTISPSSSASAKHSPQAHQNASNPDDKGPYHPDFRNQPDPRKDYWSDEAWETRYIIDIPPFHLFGTRSTDESSPGTKRRGAFEGGLFMLKPSDAAASKGQRVYENISTGDTLEDLKQCLIETQRVNAEYIARLQKRNLESNTWMQSLKNLGKIIGFGKSAMDRMHHTGFDVGSA